jgi:hypothetical protein
VTDDCTVITKSVLGSEVNVIAVGLFIVSVKSLLIVLLIEIDG